MTTVGYGDMSGHTEDEQLFCGMLMLVGVFFFSMISGSLASILATLDEKQADLQRKVAYLQRLRFKFNLPEDIVEEVRKSLQFDEN